MANYPVSPLPSNQGPTFRQNTKSIILFKLFLFFHSLISHCCADVCIWCEWCTSISLLHFPSSTSFKFLHSHYLCFFDSLTLHTSYSEIINVNLHSRITLHFSKVSVICFQVKSNWSNNMLILMHWKNANIAISNIIFLLGTEKGSLMRKRTR